MKINTVLEYQLKGERNNRPRKPLVFENKAFVIFVYEKKGFFESKIQCLGLDDFVLHWEYVHPHVINNLVLAENDSLLASCMNGELLNLDIHRGIITWKFRTLSGNIGPVSNEINSKAVFSGVQGNQSTWCIDTKKGEQLWCISNKGHSNRPYVYGGKILNTIGNELTCVDLNSGKTLWKVSEPKTYLFNPVAVTNFAIAPGHGLIDFFDSGKGKLLHTIKTGQPVTLSESSIREVITDDHSIYFGDAKGVFYGYSLPGPAKSYSNSLSWKIETKGGIESIPAFFNNSILLINNGNQLLRIDKTNGNILQEIKTKGQAFISGVTVHNETILYSCYGGFVVKCTV